jgi:CubicO group peptidase (beta-lactamase class C family)
MRRGYGIVIFFAMALFGMGEAEATFPDRNWNTAPEPERLGWSPAKLAVAQEYSEQIGSAAVMIVDDGVVVDSWGMVTAPLQLHSIRKPLMSALIGIHAGEGRIDLAATMDDLGIDDNPPALSAVEKQASVRDLIMARSGIYHPALGEARSMKAVRPERHSHAPGTFWYYNNWDFNTLGTIFERITGTRVCEEFEGRIAGPVGMEDFDPELCWYQSGPDSLHRYYGFRMSARDLARFGLLYLRGGRWGERQIVPEAWVSESTAIHSKIREGRGYGYMWSTVSGGEVFPNVRLRGPAFGHSGLGVHFLMVVPYRNLVIVHRVDTDKPGRYPGPHALGRLLWLILDAAGETGIGPDPAFEAAAGVRVTVSNWKPTFGKGTVQFRGVRPSNLVEGGDRPFLASFSPDGELVIDVNDVRADSGTWWLHGGRFCFRLEKTTRGRAVCRRMVVDGPKVRLFDLEGTLDFTLTRVSGQTMSPN